MYEECRVCQVVLAFQKVVKTQEEKLKEKDVIIAELRKFSQTKIDFKNN